MSSDDFEFLDQKPSDANNQKQPPTGDHAGKLKKVGELYSEEELDLLIKLSNNPGLKSMAITFMKNS